jgi:hypothetical protein
MFTENVDESYVVTQMGTSEGTQIKYYKDGFWYKKDNRGSEGRTEYLVSKLLTFSSLTSDEYVMYECGTINGNSGCRSRNFLEPDEELITLYRLYYNEFGKDLSKVISQMETMEERIRYVLAFVKDSCALDLTDYFKKVFTLDLLVLNEDRHLNNLAVILKENHFEVAPIYDNGVSLLTANQSVNWRFGIEENVKRVIARPFSGSHEKMQAYFGKGFTLEVDAAIAWLDTEPDSREKEVLRYQLEKYRFLLQERKSHGSSSYHSTGL